MAIFVSIFYYDIIIRCLFLQRFTIDIYINDSKSILAISIARFASETSRWLGFGYQLQMFNEFIVTVHKTIFDSNGLPIDN